jgi:hypothetical protein
MPQVLCRARLLPRARLQQRFLGCAPVPRLPAARASYAVAVQHAATWQPLQEGVPVAASAVRCGVQRIRDRLLVGRVRQHQRDARGVARKHRKVDARSAAGLGRTGAQRLGGAWRNKLAYQRSAATLELVARVLH